MPPSTLIVTNICPLQGGVSYEGGRSNQKSFLMRGVIVPPSKLIVKHVVPPQGRFLIVVVLLRGEINIE